MNLLQICILLLVACFCGALALSVVEDKQQVEVKTGLTTKLPLMEKLALAAASKLRRPDAVNNNIPLLGKYLFEDYDTWAVDAVYVDLRSVLEQAKKISEDAPFPELDYFLHFDDCIIIFCFVWDITVTTGQSRLVGVRDITSNTEITPTSFRNLYTIPAFKWSCPGFVFNLTDLTYMEMHLTRDLHVSIEGLNFDTSANYEFVPGLGIQISNLSIDFNVTSFIYTIQDLTIRYSDGHEDHDGPFIYEEAEYLNEGWPESRHDYEFALQFRINCVLSGGRVDPVECASPQDENDASIGYYKMNVMQILETFGLASLTRP